MAFGHFAVFYVLGSLECSKFGSESQSFLFVSDHRLPLFFLVNCNTPIIFFASLVNNHNSTFLSISSFIGYHLHISLQKISRRFANRLYHVVDAVKPIPSLELPLIYPRLHMPVVSGSQYYREAARAVLC